MSRQGAFLWVALALVVTGEARMLASLDCKGGINVFDAERDEVALTMTGGEHILEALKEEQVGRLTRCCPKSPKSAVEERADVLGSIVKALAGKTFEADSCLDTVGGITITSSFLQQLTIIGRLMCENGRCGLELEMGNGITLRAALMKCANEKPALALFCEGNGCNVQWSDDGSCPAGFKPVSPSFDLSDDAMTCGKGAAIAWKVLSRFLG
eukprot:Sspe_Gene.7375::Locus_2496_Transcript_1_1_Confidence_1.000_Length_705::g.7375::m.7375